MIHGEARGQVRKIYLAGPDVFLPDAVAIGRRKKELCDQYGFEGLFPFDNEIDPNQVRERLDRAIYRANVKMLRGADIGICNLTPFRGPSADVGTVFELGMLVGLGKQVFGYTNIAADLLDRTKLVDKLTFDPSRQAWCDSNNMTVENFGNADNLMIDDSLIEHTGRPIVRHNARPDDLFHDLAGFEACLRLAAAAEPKSR